MDPGMPHISSRIGKSNICFRAPMHEVSEARCGRKAHREKGGAHVATEQRAMFLVIARRIGFEIGDRPLQKLRQSGRKSSAMRVAPTRCKWSNAQMTPAAPCRNWVTVAAAVLTG